MANLKLSPQRQKVLNLVKSGIHTRKALSLACKCSIQTIREHLKALEDANLICAWDDETQSRPLTEDNKATELESILNGKFEALIDKTEDVGETKYNRADILRALKNVSDVPLTADEITDLLSHHLVMGEVE
jgi:DNA-binding transcriptional ArsR family regulator